MGRQRVRAIIFTGAGDKAFCSGGDVKQRAETGDYGPTKSGLWEVNYFHKLIRDIPKPVIAAVNGVAIGGGHVLHVICDLTIACYTARFGQAGPRVGSFDAGFGTAFLARVSAKSGRGRSGTCAGSTTLRPRSAGAWSTRSWRAEELMAEAKRWAEEIAQMSPTAIKFLKHSFNADTDHQGGISNMADAGLDLFVEAPEGREGALAFTEKRKPDFAQFA